MGSTAVQIVSEAYRKHNLDEVTTFSTALDFPYNIAKDTLNDVIRFANRQGSYWFQETETPLVYGIGTYTYSFAALAVDPKRITILRKEAADKWQELKQYNQRDFLFRYRRSTVATAEPTAWTKYGDTLELNTIPDQDYSLNLYHFKDIPIVATTTDTFNIPTTDEDILIEGCYQWLGYRMGRWGLDVAQVAVTILFANFLVQINTDSGMPRQMPAAF